MRHLVDQGAYKGSDTRQRIFAPTAGEKLPVRRDVSLGNPPGTEVEAGGSDVPLLQAVVSAHTDGREAVGVGGMHVCVLPSWGLGFGVWGFGVGSELGWNGESSV
jgi:hypothetical protein